MFNKFDPCKTVKEQNKELVKKLEEQTKNSQHYVNLYTKYKDDNANLKSKIDETAKLEIENGRYKSTIVELRKKIDSREGIEVDKVKKRIEELEKENKRLRLKFGETKEGIQVVQINSSHSNLKGKKLYKKINETEYEDIGIIDDDKITVEKYNPNVGQWAQTPGSSSINVNNNGIKNILLSTDFYIEHTKIDEAVGGKNKYRKSRRKRKN